jgi:hypothetical protein
MTNFVSWRYVYWMSLGLQYLIFILLWLFMPDYPPTNQSLNYFYILWSIVQMLFKYAVLVQACIAAMFVSMTFTSFWTTLTFLLAGAPYHYEPLTIGLFGLIGIGGMILGPIYAKLVTDKFVPHLSVFVGLFCCLIGICLGTYVGRFNISGPIFQAALLDFGMQTAQIANRSAIYAIEPKRRNGVNTAFMVSTFIGQLVGTAAGNHIYARAGWIGSGSASVAFMGAAILTMVARGPWEDGWIGWGGGWSMKKKDKNSADGRTAEVEHHRRPSVEGNNDDPELGAIEKAVAEMAADESNEDPLREDKETREAEKERESDIEKASSTDKSRRSSGEEEIRPVKVG